MGYFNPIHKFGPERFLDAAIVAGVDGLIVVDLPPEEDAELCLPALAKGLNFIRLATPTTDDKRLPKVLGNTSGFIYYVSITGITGAAAPVADMVGPAVERIRATPPAGRGRLRHPRAGAGRRHRPAGGRCRGRLGPGRRDRPARRGGRHLRPRCRGPRQGPKPRPGGAHGARAA
jgi:hypothetical protein